MKIAAIGRTSFLWNAITALSAAGHEIKAIITTKAAPEYSKKEADFQDLARQHNLPFFMAKSLMDPGILKAIKGADIAVSVNWTHIFTKEDIRLFKHGILNAHLGDLPRYRGNACANWALIKGEKNIVLSIHLVEADQLDCGRILSQNKIPIKNTTSIGDVYQWAEGQIPLLFNKAILALQKNPQYALKYADIKGKGSMRCYPRRPQDSLIRWEDPAAQIHRLIRASSKPFAGAYAFLEGERITIWKAELYKDRELYCAVPGQICAIDQEFFIVITGKGKLKITAWECSKPVKSIRQRLTVQP